MPGFRPTRAPHPTFPKPRINKSTWLVPSFEQRCSISHEVHWRTSHLMSSLAHMIRISPFQLLFPPRRTTSSCLPCNKRSHHRERLRELAFTLDCWQDRLLCEKAFRFSYYHQCSAPVQKFASASLSATVEALELGSSWFQTCPLYHTSYKPY